MTEEKATIKIKELLEKNNASIDLSSIQKISDFTSIFKGNFIREGYETLSKAFLKEMQINKKLKEIYQTEAFQKFINNLTELSAEYSIEKLIEYNFDEVTDLMRIFEKSNFEYTEEMKDRAERLNLLFKGESFFNNELYRKKYEGLLELTIEDVEKEFKKTNKKKKKPNLKIDKDFASAVTSGLVSEIMKETKANKIDRAEQQIISQRETDMGTVQIVELIPNMDYTSPNTDEELLRQYDLLKQGYTREAFQLFQALFGVFLIEGKKKDYNQPIFISIKDLHYNILGHNKNTKFRSKDVDYYRRMAHRLSRPRIHYTTVNAKTNSKNSYLLKGKFKNTKIDGNIMNVEFIEGESSEYKEQVYKVIPTTYMQYEAKLFRQISNCLPREFLNLKESDNFVYFGFYINKMHKLNSRQKFTEEKTVKGKILTARVNRQVTTWMWEVNFKKIIEEAIPTGKKLIIEFEKTERKKQFLERNIVPYLVKALDIYKAKGYILKYNKKDFTNKNIITKNIFDEETGLKVKLIFNYQKEKFKSQKP